MTEIRVEQFPNGLVVLLEPVPGVRSAAVTIRVPAGYAVDASAKDGAAAMLSELVLRGAGDRDSRAFSDALDRLGVQRGSDVHAHHIELSATCLGPALPSALELLADAVRRPHIGDDAVDAVRSLCLQELEGLDDDPQGRVMLHLRARHRPPPFDRHGLGRAEALEHLDGPALRALWPRRAAAHGSIIAIAGAFEMERTRDTLQERFREWGGVGADPAPTGPPARGAIAVPHESAQVHLALAWDAPRERDPDAMLERVAVSILGGASSGRLFTRARVERGLCYSIGASYSGGRDEGIVTAYAGTTPERAQETLDVILAEARRLREGVTQEEFESAIIRLKSRVVMAGESVPARAGRLASDWFRLGRPRTLAEVASAIDAVTFEAVNDFCARRRFGRLSLATMGPVTLDAAAIDRIDEDHPAGLAV